LSQLFYVNNASGGGNPLQGGTRENPKAHNNSISYAPAQQQQQMLLQQQQRLHNISQQHVGNVSMSSISANALNAQQQQLKYMTQHNNGADRGSISKSMTFQKKK
jgi:hypothetical protein